MTDATAPQGLRHTRLLDGKGGAINLDWDKVDAWSPEQMNERMYVLSIVAAIFLPLSFFTGLMGINMGGMPGVEDQEAFWVVVGLCVGLILLLAAVFRWKRWL